MAVQPNPEATAGPSGKKTKPKPRKKAPKPRKPTLADPEFQPPPCPATHPGCPLSPPVTLAAELDTPAPSDLAMVDSGTLPANWVQGLSDQRFTEEIKAQQVPDWSLETLRLLQDCTPLQRSFVEWMATGRNAAEAYRMATRNLLAPNASQLAGVLKNKPEVKAALESALKDRSVEPRFDRQWRLTKLGSLIARYDMSPDPRDWEKIPDLIELMSKIQGDLVQKQEVKHEGDVKIQQQTDIRIRVEAIIAEALGPRPVPTATGLEELGPNHAAPVTVTHEPARTGPSADGPMVVVKPRPDLHQPAPRVPGDPVDPHQPRTGPRIPFPSG